MKYAPQVHLMWACVLQSDRPKAQKAMEATWSTMEKKEKIMWIKKAAEDQKRYEVSGVDFTDNVQQNSTVFVYRMSES